jgi:hypothetical protein
MDDPRWEPGMPVLDRQAVPDGPSDAVAATAVAGSMVAGRARAGSSLPASLQGLPPRSVPETRPTPLQPYYIYLSVVVLFCGAIAITALNLGVPASSPLVKACVLVGAPLLVATTLDATLRIWRSAWAWMPVDRVKGVFRLCWVVATLTIVAIGIAFSLWVLAA